MPDDDLRAVAHHAIRGGQHHAFPFHPTFHHLPIFIAQTDAAFQHTRLTLLQQALRIDFGIGVRLPHSVERDRALFHDHAFGDAVDANLTPVAQRRFQRGGRVILPVERHPQVGQHLPHPAAMGARPQHVPIHAHRHRDRTLCANVQAVLQRRSRIGIDAIRAVQLDAGLVQRRADRRRAGVQRRAHPTILQDNLHRTLHDDAEAGLRRVHYQRGANLDGIVTVQLHAELRQQVGGAFLMRINMALAPINDHHDGPGARDLDLQSGGQSGAQFGGEVVFGTQAHAQICHEQFHGRLVRPDHATFTINRQRHRRQRRPVSRRQGHDRQHRQRQAQQFS